MLQIELEPSGYRETGRKPGLVIHRGLAKWLYFARHPILAFVTYQTAYPDDDDGAFVERQSNAILFGIGTFLIHKLHSG